MVWTLSRATSSISSGGQELPLFSHPEMTVSGILRLAPLPVESGNEVNSMSRMRVMTTLISDIAMQFDGGAWSVVTVVLIKADTFFMYA